MVLDILTSSAACWPIPAEAVVTATPPAGAAAPSRAGPMAKVTPVEDEEEAGRKGSGGRKAGAEAAAREEAWRAVAVATGEEPNPSEYSSRGAGAPRRERGGATCGGQGGGQRGAPDGFVTFEFVPCGAADWPVPAEAVTWTAPPSTGAATTS